MTLPSSDVGAVWSWLDDLARRASPWQKPYVERLIGSIRRDCLHHVIVLSERHLRRILRLYLGY
jgi:hypothetical protein